MIKYELFEDEMVIGLFKTKIKTPAEKLLCDFINKYKLTVISINYFKNDFTSTDNKITLFYEEK